MGEGADTHVVNLLRAADLASNSDAALLRAVARRWPAIRSALSNAYNALWSEAEHVSYGGYYGGDPRDFHPDPERSTDAERAAHANDCAAWTEWEAAGSQGDPPKPSVRYGHAPITRESIGGGSDVNAVNTLTGHVTFAGYGLGTTTWRNEELAQICDELAAIIFVTAHDGILPSVASTAETTGATEPSGERGTP